MKIKKIIKALKIIQSNCENNVSCNDCMFSCEGYCTFKNSLPNYWHIKALNDYLTNGGVEFIRKVK